MYGIFSISLPKFILGFDYEGPNEKSFFLDLYRKNTRNHMYSGKNFNTCLT